METLEKIKKLVEELSINSTKVFLKGNRSACIRARKNAQEIRILVGEFRKELLEETKKNDK